MTPDLYELPARDGSTRQVHLLAPGMVPVPFEEARRLFAWNQERAALWDLLEAAAPRLKERYGVTHVAGAGGLFSTDWWNPSDLDVVTFHDPSAPEIPNPRRDPNPLAGCNRSYGDDGIHARPWDFPIEFEGGLNSLWALSYTATNPRPSFGMGHRVGMALLELP